MRVTVSFFRKYAGGTLLDTLSMSIPGSGVLYNKYDFNAESRQWLAVVSFNTVIWTF